MTMKLSVALLFFAVGCISGSPYASRKSYQPNGRIVGGFELNITDAPWQVSLQSEGILHWCGGSIIGPQWILTAAHCLKSYVEDPWPLRVRIGATYKDGEGDVIRIERIFMHPRYSQNPTDYDFGLIRLKSPIAFNDKATPIKMVDFGDAELPSGTNCLVSGWGSTMNPNESSNRLRGAEVPLVDQKLCNRAYNGQISARMICAGDYENGGKDSCQGDSGGPLVAFAGPDKTPTLVGIVSWGYGCARPKFPGVYARVLAAREWIDAHTHI